MGQIFNRISRIAKAYWSDVSSADEDWAERLINSNDEDLRQAIDELNSSRDRKTSKPNEEIIRAHTLLSLQIGSSAEEVKVAYRKAVRQWHPDKYVNASVEEQHRAQQKTQDINAAYLILKIYYKFT